MRKSDIRRCAARVDLSAIRSNMLALSALAPEKKICCVIKADAYGHGACEAAGALDEGTDVFAVATADEGIRLRAEGGIRKPILILSPVFPSEDESCIRFGLTETVFGADRAGELNRTAAGFFAANADQAEASTHAFADKKAHVHIAVDTGMSRIGLSPDEKGLEVIKKIRECGHISVDGIFTHFATADETDKRGAMLAYRRFSDFRKLCAGEGINIPIWHAANTASVIDGIALDDDMDMARLGIGLYGMYPSDEVIKSNVKLKYAMHWFSYITFIKNISPGTSVSYGYTYTAGTDMRIATVCCGYADGYPRLLSNRGEVIVRGIRCPIVGRVCMDQFMIDVSHVPDAAEGDEVTLMGSDGDETITPEEIAALTGTICYEITCGVSARVPRIYG